jgi:hypothetical protein
MRLASKRYVKPEAYSHTDPSLEHFPSLPIHSNLSNFKKDDTADFFYLRSKSTSDPV